MRLVRLPSSVGMVPENKLLSSKSQYSLVRLVSSMGMAPESRLLLRVRLVSAERLPISAGKVPLMPGPGLRFSAVGKTTDSELKVPFL